METGKILRLEERDMGFIKCTNAKEPLYFHADDLSGMRFKDLHAGDRVQFSITESLKGPYATQVSRFAA